VGEFIISQEENMKSRRLLKWNIVILLVLLLSLFAGTAASARPADRADEITIDVFRLNKTWVIIKITFPYDLEGDFAGTLASKHVDCQLVSSNVLICLARFRVGSDPSYLTIYDQDTKENILQEVIGSPDLKDGDPEEPPAAPPGDDDSGGDDDSSGCPPLC
jgi:hypothetical protein